MPRLNKITEKVFAEIAETSKKKGAYTTFLDIDKILGLPESESLKELKDMYLDLVNESKGNISTLACIEEIIIQIRAKEAVDSEIRLSLSRPNKRSARMYIYARSLFYRRGNKINDIRVMVGNTDDFGDNVDVLLGLKGFMADAKKKLLEAMDKEIDQNILTLKSLMRV